MSHRKSSKVKNSTICRDSEANMADREKCKPQNEQYHHRSIPPTATTSAQIMAKTAAAHRSRKSKKDLDYIGIFLLCFAIVITFATNPGGWENTGKVKWQHVYYYGWITAVSTGLGALPFVFIQEPNKFWMGVSNALAAGMMVAASRSLFLEGWNLQNEDNETVNHGILGVLASGRPETHGMYRTISGIVLGVVFIYVTQKILDCYEDLSVGEIAGSDAKKMILIMFVMTLHSLSEGIGVGVSFGGEAGMKLGQFISMSLAVHNIPEGLAVALVLKGKRVSTLRTVLWAIFTSLPQPLFAVPAYMFIERFAPLLPGGLGFAAGAMGYVALFELLGEAVEDTKSWTVTLAVTTASYLAMTAIQDAVKLAI